MLQGICEGPLLHIDSAESLNDCLALCKNEPECNWYNFDEDFNACLLNKDCTNFDEAQQDFVTGQRKCSLSSTQFKNVMIVGGFNGDNLDDVEIVSLNDTSTCMKPADYPLTLKGMVGTFGNRMALVCGGYYNGSSTSDCFSYDFDDGIWLPQASMGEERSYAGAVMLNDSHWWITGGYGAGLLISTELYNLESHLVSPFHNLPIATDYHFVLKIDESRFFLCCGRAMPRKSYILDLETEIWNETPPSQYDHGRGFAGKT